LSRLAVNVLLETIQVIGRRCQHTAARHVHCRPGAAKQRKTTAQRGIVGWFFIVDYSSIGCIHYAASGCNVATFGQTRWRSTWLPRHITREKTFQLHLLTELADCQYTEMKNLYGSHQKKRKTTEKEKE